MNNIQQCCTSPYTCEAVTGSTRTSMCNGVNLPEGSSCWESSAVRIIERLKSELDNIHLRAMELVAVD